MRIAALGFHHETNTFQSVKTDYDSFADYEFLRGSQIADRHATSKFTLAGYFQSAQKFEFDLVPLLWAFTGPTGTITKDAFDRTEYYSPSTEQLFPMNTRTWTERFPAG